MQHLLLGNCNFITEQLQQYTNPKTNGLLYLRNIPPVPGPAN